MTQHHSVAHHKAMAQAAKKRGDLKGAQRHMAEAKEAAKKKK